jgi:hypothetical protein
MPDVKSEVQKTAAELTRVGKDAAYVAIGLGVLGLQKAQVRRQELKSQLGRAPVGDVRKELAKALKELDKTFGQLIERMDATFEPVSERLPAGAQAVVQQAKEARDQVRGYLTSLAA